MGHTCFSPIPVAGIKQLTLGCTARLGEMAEKLERVATHHRDVRMMCMFAIGDLGADVLHSDRAADGGCCLESLDQPYLDKLDIM